MNTLRFPSALQLRYAQNVFGFALPPDVILTILVEIDDETFYKLCFSPEFRSFCSENSAYSERIYEERARKRVAREYSEDIIQFKPKAVLDNQKQDSRILKPAMKWKEFDRRMADFIYFGPNANELAGEGKLMELQILNMLGTGYPNVYGANLAAENGHLDVLKWIYENRTIFYSRMTILPDVNGAAAGFGHLHVLKWIDEVSKNTLLPSVNGLNWAAENGHLDVLKWVYEQGLALRQPSLLPSITGANWAAQNGHLDVLKWLYEKRLLSTDNSTRSSGFLSNWIVDKAPQHIVDWYRDVIKGVSPSQN